VDVQSGRISGEHLDPPRLTRLVGSVIGSCTSSTTSRTSGCSGLGTEASGRLDEMCVEIGRDPGEIRWSVQLFAGGDPVELMERLLAKASGLGHRRIAATPGLPASTVRGWLRRFSRRAAELRALAAELAHRYDAELGPIAPQGSPTADAVEALGVAAGAVVRRFGPVRSPWPVISAITGAPLLSPAVPPAW
jgi:hypothetical protein